MWARDDVGRDDFADFGRRCSTDFNRRFDRAEPAAVRSTKRILAHAGPRSAQLDFAATCFARSLRSTAEEGIAAFTSKRAPAWQQSLPGLPEMPR